MGQILPFSEEILAVIGWWDRIPFFSSIGHDPVSNVPPMLMQTTLSKQKTGRGRGVKQELERNESGQWDKNDQSIIWNV